MPPSLSLHPFTIHRIHTSTGSLENLYPNNKETYLKHSQEALISLQNMTQMANKWKEKVPKSLETCTLKPPWHINSHAQERLVPKPKPEHISVVRRSWNLLLKRHESMNCQGWSRSFHKALNLEGWGDGSVSRGGGGIWIQSLELKGKAWHGGVSV